MRYTFNQGKIITNSIEYSVAYHCNLRCVQCSHLSPYMDTQFPAIESFREDLFCLSKMIHAKVIRLLGGEPLLNPDIDRFIAIAKESRIADAVMVTTNGLLLHRMSSFFWENVDYVLVSLYPRIDLKESFSVLKKRAGAHNTRLWFQIISHFRTMIVTTPHNKDWLTTLIFRSCRDVHHFHCHMIHQGMLYKCAVPPFLRNYAAKLGHSYDPIPDGFAIHHSSNSYSELRKYLTDMKAKEACRYCLGSAGEMIPHSQLLNPPHSFDKEVPITRENNVDTKRLIKEGWSIFFKAAREIIPPWEKRW